MTVEPSTSRNLRKELLFPALRKAPPCQRAFNVAGTSRGLKAIKQEKPDDIAFFKNRLTASKSLNSTDVVELNDSPVKQPAKGYGKNDAASAKETQKRKSADETDVPPKKPKGQPLAVL
ncbi:hypothetical protein AAVH_14441 [Aphelenchoides avenae]|nr:hypothetical protein AAVH_14441 [Aphelenchus avenae]